jgi:hypothetical protein
LGVASLGNKMRKLIFLALGLGTLELLKREARRRGITPGALAGEKVSNAATWLCKPDKKAAEENRLT